MSLQREVLASFLNTAVPEDISSLAGTTDEGILELIHSSIASSNISAFSSNMLSSNGSLLRSLINMGVRQSKFQLELYDALSKDSTAQAFLTKLSSKLSSNTFLLGPKITAADVIVAIFNYDLFTIGFPPSLFQQTPLFSILSPWFVNVISYDSIDSVIQARGLSTGGVIRVGGQVDLRASHSKVAILADISVEKNKKLPKAKEDKVHEAPAVHSVAEKVAAVSLTPAAAAQPESNKTFPSKSVEEKIKFAQEKLTSFGCAFETISHPPANTVQDLLAAVSTLPGIPVKNLLLKAKKEKSADDSRIWLVCAAHDTKVDLADLAKRLGYGKIQLRFAEADVLLENLGVTPGHVSPLCLVLDEAHLVNVAVDQRLLEPGAKVLVHPLTNEASCVISSEDLVKYIAASGHSHVALDFSAEAK
jgi:Ala-tRNA(Pro) deacylase